MHEDLSRERGKTQELQKQVLDQASSLLPAALPASRQPAYIPHSMQLKDWQLPFWVVLHCCCILCTRRMNVHSLCSAVACPLIRSLTVCSALQAMELDEAQRDAHDVFALRQQLSTAQQAEAHLRQQLGQLRQQLAASSAASGSCGTGGEDDQSPSRSSGGSARGSGAGSCNASPTKAGRQAALQARLEAATKELAAVKQEVSRKGWLPAAGVGLPAPVPRLCMPCWVCW